MTIHISVASGGIVCRDKGGNVHAARRDWIDWVGDNNLKFTLVFEDFISGNVVPWPFDPETEPKWPVPKWGGHIVAAKIPTYYKYIVKVDGYPALDPIVIVDK